MTPQRLAAVRRIKIYYSGCNFSVIENKFHNLCSGMSLASENRRLHLPTSKFLEWTTEQQNRFPQPGYLASEQWFPQDKMFSQSRIQQFCNVQSCSMTTNIALKGPEINIHDDTKLKSGPLRS